MTQLQENKASTSFGQRNVSTMFNNTSGYKVSFPVLLCTAIIVLIFTERRVAKLGEMGG
jgi:hypothetical protein